MGCGEWGQSHSRDFAHLLDAMLQTSSLDATSTSSFTLGHLQDATLQTSKINMALRRKHNFLKPHWKCEGKEYENHRNDAWRLNFALHVNIMSLKNVMKGTTENQSLGMLSI